MHVIDELASLSSQIQAKEFNKDRQQSRAQQQVRQYKAASQLPAASNNTLIMPTEDRRSGKDRRQDKQITERRFDPRNQNDRRKYSLISCQV
ncbi:hypothetical protein [Thalassotalea sp. PLHSN55]|uniref:hypothetical protein n=1 Tax=Thalassotalea sp. PLHSN55 TaxID=3435888 RepID=UPI003F845426